MVETTIKVETVSAQTLPPINVREGDAPGEATARAIRRGGGGGGVRTTTFEGSLKEYQRQAAAKKLESTKQETVIELRKQLNERLSKLNSTTQAEIRSIKNIEQKRIRQELLDRQINKIILQTQRQEDLIKNSKSIEALKRNQVTIGDVYTAVKEGISAQFLRPTSLFPQESTTLQGPEIEEKSKYVRRPFVEAVSGGTTTVTGKIKDALSPNFSLFPEVIPSNNALATGISLVAALKESQFRGVKESKDFQESVKEAKQVSIQQQRDINVINNKINALKNLDKEIKELNKEIEEKNKSGGFQPNEYEEIRSKQFDLNDKRNKILSPEMGVTTSVEDGQIKFTSKALETDIGGGAVKQLEEVKKRGGSTGIRVAGAITSEVAEGAALGTILGATGVTARVGNVLGNVGTAVKPFVQASPFFPLATRGGMITATVGVIGTAAGVKGYQFQQAGAQRGVGTSAFILGAGEVLGKSAGFIGGSVIGSRLFTTRTLEQLRTGKITKEIAIKRGVKVGEGQFMTEQISKAKTKVPATKIRIDSTGRIVSAETQKKGFGVGRIKSEVTGITGKQKFTSDVYLFREDKVTGQIIATKIPKGFEVSKFRINFGDVILKENQVSKVFGQDAKSIIMQVKSGTTSLGEPVVVGKVNPWTGYKTLFTEPGERVSVSKSIFRVTPTKEGGFFTVGGTKTVDMDLFKRAYSSALKKGFAIVKETSTQLILQDKKGQILAITKPLVTPPLTTPPPVSAIPAPTPITTGTLGTITSEIAPQIASQQLASTLIGAGALLTTTVPAQVLVQQPEQSKVLFTPELTLQTTAIGVTPAFVDTTTTKTANITASKQVQIIKPKVTTPTQVTSITPTPITTFIPSAIVPPPIGFGGLFKSAIAKVQAKKKAYDVYVKRKGKFSKVADDLPLGVAKRRGANITKRTLASHFRVKLDKKATTKKNDIPFEPDPAIFRKNRIVRGRSVPLPQGPDVYEYIERKKKRLTTRGETVGLVAARKPKGGLFGFGKSKIKLGRLF